MNLQDYLDISYFCQQHDLRCEPNDVKTINGLFDSKHIYSIYGDNTGISFLFGVDNLDELTQMWDKLQEERKNNKNFQLFYKKILSN